MYYLMVKTHNTTGLKYLCQTKRTDPFKYTGSGKYWRAHLQKHGCDISTHILGTYSTSEELAKAGLQYSEEYDVVASSAWANLKPEAGDGGDTSKTQGYREGMAKRRSYSGTANPNYGKRSPLRGTVGKASNWPWFNNGVEQTRAAVAPLGWVHGRLKVQCEHCNKSITKTNYTRWHGPSCKAA